MRDGHTRDLDSWSRRRAFLRILTTAVVLLPLAAAPSASAIASTRSGTLVHLRVVKTSKWSPPSPDPTGLTFRRGARVLLVSDSEVDEMPALWRKRNLFIVGQRGRLRRTARVTAQSREPEDIAWDTRRQRLYVTDDDRDRVFRFFPGPDRLIGTADDTSATILRTHLFGSGDPEGLAYRGLDRSFFLTDPTRGRIYHVKRGGDGRFNTADDVVTSFSSSSVGITQPEGVEYEARSKHLYIVGSSDSVIAVTTVKGTLRSTIDFSFAGAVNPSAITIAPSDAAHPRTRVFIADRGLDNGTHPAENDGRIFIFFLRR